MKLEKKEWLPIIISIPIGIVTYYITSFLSLALSLTITAITILLAILLSFSEKIRAWVATRNYQSRSAEANRLNNELILLDNLKSDFPKLLAGIIWDVLRIIVFSCIILVLFLLTLLILIRISWPEINFDRVLLVMSLFGYGVFFYYFVEAKRMSYIKHIYKFDEYKKKTEEKIASLHTHS